MQQAGWSPVTHHTTLSHRFWVTTDYKHTLQSIHSILGRSAETYPTTMSHRDRDLPVHTYWSTGWDMNPWPWGLKPWAQPLDKCLSGGRSQSHLSSQGFTNALKFLLENQSLARDSRSRTEGCHIQCVAMHWFVNKCHVLHLARVRFSSRGCGD